LVQEDGFVAIAGALQSPGQPCNPQLKQVTPCWKKMKISHADAEEETSLIGKVVVEEEEDWLEQGGRPHSFC